MDQRLNHILKWKKGTKCPPITLELFPTFECNQNCIFCPRKEIFEEESKNLLSYEKILNLIDEASDLGVQKVDVIGGGEPLKFKYYMQLFEKIKKYDMFGYLNTNFSLLKEDNLRKLAEYKWDYIKISLHAPNSTHDVIVGKKGSFGSIIKNMNLLNKYKKKLKSELPILEFGPVLFNQNYKYVVEFIKLASKFNVRNVFFQPVIQYKNKKDFKLKKEQINFLLKNLGTYESLANRLNVNINLKNILNNGLIEKADKREIKNKKEIYCYEPWLHMAVWPNGTCSSCSFPQIGERTDIRNKTLRDIWFGAYFEKLRKNMKNGIVPEHCGRCVANVVLDNVKLKEELKKKR